MSRMQWVLGRVGRGLWRVAGQSLDLLLPPQCPVCQALVGGAHQLCADCFGRMNFITAPLCLRCGVAFATPGEAGPQGQCLGCLLRPPAFRRARGALRYDDAARRLILPFKHGDRTELAPVLAAMMARAGSALLSEADAVLPVPLHRHRLRARRYNQAALLARGLAGRTGRPWLPDALIRQRETPPLGELSAAARLQAVSDAFAVRPSRRSLVEGRRLLLVDDVMTSGATASACADVLLAAGAAAVDVLVAARVPTPGDRTAIPLVEAGRSSDLATI
jgi:ComF family protein